jgi:hypothetical protein
MFDIFNKKKLKFFKEYTAHLEIKYGNLTKDYERLKQEYEELEKKYRRLKLEAQLRGEKS